MPKVKPIINQPISDRSDDSSRRILDSELHSEPEGIDVTVVVPMRNEEANVARVCAELQEVMDKEVLRYEVIIIYDGSSDGTAGELERATQHDPRFTILECYRSFGQSAGLSAGFRLARGKIIVPMDGDLQNDAHDIPRLIAHL